MKTSKQEKEWLLREKYGGKETLEFLNDIKRLRSGEPLGYIIGNVPFLNCTIDLSLLPLIPRGETEYWVNERVQEIKKTFRQKIEVLDAFAGSGCIGVALLANISGVRVDFIEGEPHLAKQIQINIRKNDISPKRCKIISGNILYNIPKKQYDYVFANPPYVPHESKLLLSRSVVNFEPHAALFAKDRGLFYIKYLVTLAPKILAPNGKMWIEFGYGQKERLKEFLRKKHGLQYSFLKDQYARWRVLEISYKMDVNI